jgi:hypothetical protein
MKTGKLDQTAKQAASKTRHAKLAEGLRANLLKRKAQSRARKEKAPIGQKKAGKGRHSEL